LKALITGIAGFVGPYLTSHLMANSIDCTGISLGSVEGSVSLPASVPIFNADIRERSAIENILREVQPDYLIHLAAITSVPFSFSEPALTYEINVNGTLSVLEAVRRVSTRTRVLNVSSAHVYGTSDTGTKGFTEQAALCPESPYATSKAAAEMIAADYARSSGVDVLMARAFNHTGPGQSPIFVASDFAKQVAAIKLGLAEPVIRTGNLNAKRDFSDVRDVVAGYLALLKRGRKGEVYNICSGSLYSVREVLEHLIAFSGVEVRVEVDPAKVRKTEVLQLGGNCSKIKEHTGWAPTIPMEMTLKDLLEYWTSELGNSPSTAAN
jgi:GDP-4-dehydro-6-deoxy-D-mannose reductase